MLQRFAQITCRHAHELLSERMDRPLSLLARLKLRFHLRACELCSRVEGQMDFIRQAMRRLGS